MKKEKYGFVYIWYDRKHKRFYIGSHWGDINDGYVCSSPWMSRAYKRRKQDFKRRILTFVYSNKKDLLDEEYKWLSMIKKEELRKRYYNLHNHHFGHWSTDENTKLSVAEKIKKHHATEEFKKQASEAKLGDKNPMKRPEVVAKRVETYKKGNHEPWNKNKKLGPNPEHSKRMKGRPSPLKGKKKNYSEETRSKMGWSKGKKLKPLSQKTKEKIGQKNSAILKKKYEEGLVVWNKGLKTGKSWYTNGIISGLYLPSEVPEGFVKGRHKRKK